MVRAKKMKKAESLIGNKAYTLVEVLCAIIVISIGAAFIFPALFKSEHVLSSLPRRFEAEILLSNQLATAEELFSKKGFLASFSSNGEEEINGRKYSYRADFFALNSTRSVYEMRAEASWKDSKENKISRTGFIAR